MAESKDVTSIKGNIGVQNTSFMPDEARRSISSVESNDPEVYRRLVIMRDRDSTLIDSNTAFPPNDPRYSGVSSLTRSMSHTLSLPQENGKEVVVVLGGGDFGRALTTQLNQAGYHVVVATRNAHKASERLARTGGVIMSQSEGLAKSPLVFVAIPSQHHSSLPIPALHNKVLVDVSNRTPEDLKSPRSNAENLQMLVPSAVVVKAFNNLSAYALERNLHSGREVRICCDLEWPANLVTEVARKMGLQPVPGGSLDHSRELETANLKFFPEWKFTFILVMVVFWINWIIMFFRNLICGNIDKDHSGDWDWSGFSSVMICTSALGLTAIMVLSLTYLPGVIAAYVQLYRGTKYSEFPKWLDTWLLNRKYLGLSMLFFALMHIFGEIVSGSLTYGLRGSVIQWRNPTYLWFGMMTAALLIVLGITSLPSVSKALTWKEFVVIQSKLGWISLVFATVHVVVISWSSLFANRFKCYIIPSGTQLAVILPFITLAMKLPLLMPCVDKRLTQIRRGFEFIKNNN